MDLTLVAGLIALAAVGFFVWPKIKPVLVEKKPETKVEKATSEIIQVLDLEQDPLMCLTSLSGLDYTQRLQCYKALRNHVMEVSGVEAAQKLDKEVLPIIIDDKNI